MDKIDPEEDYIRRGEKYHVKLSAKDEAEVQKIIKQHPKTIEQIKREERMICRLCDCNHSRGGIEHHKNTIAHIDELAKANNKYPNKIYCESCNSYHAKKGKSQHTKTKKHMNNIAKISE